MNCPRCNVELIVSQRQGVEIDPCPQCRGVWLDRGELDKIIDRYAAYEPGYRRGQDYRDHHAPKRRSFWNELFD